MLGGGHSHLLAAALAVVLSACWVFLSPLLGRAEPIKTMKLYSNIERIDRELQELGIAEGMPIDPAQLFALDSLHYEGTDAVDAAIDMLGLRTESKVLDVGSGLGGPARYIAHRAGASVTALELQSDVHAKAEQLTERTGLTALVRHRNANILTCDPASLGGGAGSFDAVVSWLVFLHIPDKAALLARSAAMVKAGGMLYVEDFFARGTFSAEEERSLRDDVYCEALPSREQYVEALGAAGFVDVRFEEKTADWSAFVAGRLQAFEAARERHVRVHSEATYESLHHFYASVARLFAGGNLGGVRITAKRVSN